MNRWKTFLREAGLILPMVAMPAMVFAAEEHGEAAHELNLLKDIVFPYINFALLLIILIALLRRIKNHFPPNAHSARLVRTRICFSASAGVA